MGKIGGLEDVVSSILDERDHLLQIWNHDSIGEDLHERWKNSKVLRGLEDLLTSLESAPNSTQTMNADADHPDVDGLSDDARSYHRMQLYRVLSEEQGTNNNPLAESSSNGLHRLSAAADMLATTVSVNDELTLPPRKRQRVENADTPYRYGSPLNLPKRATKMLDFYFPYTHSWLPIVERHQVLRTMYAYSEGPIDSSENLSADHAVLWAILALGSRQYVAAFEYANHYSADVDRDGIYRIARDLIPREDHSYEMGHVQALVLLSIVDFGEGRLSAAWSLIGHAFRIAIDLGLASVPDQQVARIVVLACFVLDTVISARLGRRPHARSQDALTLGRVDENGLEEWDPWKDWMGESSPDRKPAFVFSTFNMLIDVCVILNDLICDSPSIPYEKGQAYLGRLHSTRSLSRELRLWLADPRTLRNQPNLPHQIFLMTIFKTTELAIDMRSYPFLNAFENPERAAPEAFARLSGNILEFLEGYNTYRFTWLLPAITEYPMHLSFQAAVLSKRSFGSGRKTDDHSFGTWLRDMIFRAASFQKCWSGFGAIQNVMSKEASGNVLNLGPGPTSALPSTMLASQAADSVGDSSNQLAFDAAQADPIQSNWLMNQAVSNPNISDSNTFRINTNSPDFARSITGSDTLMSSVDPSLALVSSTPMPGGINMPSTNFDTQSMSTYSTSMPMEMTNDLDALFDDLAHLDTTDWAIEREHGFKDFGFNDEMTFRAFCNDPERLNASNSATPFMSIPHQQTQPISSTYLTSPPTGGYSAVQSNITRQRSSSKDKQSTSQLPTVPESVGW